MFGTTLVVVNPVARSGKAARAAAAVAHALGSLKDEGEVTSIDMRYTVAPRDGERIATREGKRYDTVVAVGGDGVVSEVVNGLMSLPAEARPRFALVPCGNGDDFGRSLGMERKPRKSVEQLSSGSLRRAWIDVVRVNERWCAETLSFGLDAAIALQTTKLRTETNRTGTSLYLQAALDQVKNHRQARTITLRLDGNDPFTVDAYLLAVQNGPTYGGGFALCADAKLDDGALDICYATPTITASRAVRLLAKAKSGKAVDDPHLTHLKARHLTVDLEKPAPIQNDGERLGGLHFDIELHKDALEVYAAPLAALTR